MYTETQYCAEIIGSKIQFWRKCDEQYTKRIETVEMKKWKA